MEKTIQHFITISKHKFYVMIFCFKCGLYKQGLLHDLSKYSPIEFLSGVKYFNGKRSPIDIEKSEKGYSAAWQHHKGRNPHHWEYWIDNIGSNAKLGNPPDAINMPLDYVLEMICDWLGAGIVYSKEKPSYKIPYDVPINYYEAHRSEKLINKNTVMLIENLLMLIKEEGINAFCLEAKRIRRVKWRIEKQEK